MRLDGAIALITGAASGIGKAVTDRFQQEGAVVIAADLNEPAAPSRGRALRLDVTSEPEWQDAMQSIPRLDILVACAGCSDARPLADTTLADWRRVLSVNLDGAFLSVKHAAAAMSSGGSIVLVSSTSGIKAAPGAAAYCASKAGVRMLAKAAALELKPRAIRVNSLSPAGVVTPLWKKMPFWDSLVQQHGSEEAAWQALGGADPATPPMQRMSFPEEVAAAALFLASSESAHMTGADLVFDGGYTA